MNAALKRYPKTANGDFMVRPMNASDGPALVAFFRRIPVDERQLFREDVTQGPVIEGWIRHLDYERLLPLLAYHGEQVVADATLHRETGGWSRHLGKIRVTLDPDFRRRGLARMLIQEFIDLAKPLGLAVLQAEILDVQKHAELLFEDMGFQWVATLPQQVIDLSGRVHDLQVYSQAVRMPESLAPEAKLKEADADVGGG